MNILSGSGVAKRFGERTLFSGVSFDVRSGDKIGLIGVNGCGKTTLFKLITGELAPDEGQLHTGRYVTTGYVRQRVLTGETSVYDEALEVFSRLSGLEKDIANITARLSSCSDADEQQRLIRQQSALTEEFEKDGGYTYKSRTRAALSGLGFDENMQCQPVGSLSGGERAKVLLCRMLLSGAELLLLDEPTNHLDIRSVQWLEDYLCSCQSAMIVISHDRYFLDKVTNRTFELENGRLRAYDGSYTVYHEKKRAQDEAERRHYKQTMREVKRIEGIIEQQKRWNREKNIVTAESKQKMIDRMTEGLEKPADAPDKLRFRFNTPPPGGNDIITASGLSKSFEGKPLFENASFELFKGERMFLLGDNGCGKTTLLRILLGRTAPDTGFVRFGSNIYPAYYDQMQSALSGCKTPVDELSDSFPAMTLTEIRNVLGAFLFRGDDVFKTIDTLSGGEAARIALLKLMLTKSNLMLLDEPTNHLDIASREALEEALSGYDGTLLIVSHDRYLINKLATGVFSLTSEGVRRYEGNYDDFVRQTDAPAEEKKTAERPISAYHADKNKKREYNALKGRCERAEKAAADADKEVERLTAELCACAADYKKAAELDERLSAAKQTAEDACALWLELCAELESTAAEL